MSARRSVAAVTFLVAVALLSRDTAPAADSPDPFAVAGVSRDDAQHAFNDLQNAVRANDASAVADLVAWPLRINLPDGKHREIAERKQFLVEYPALFADKLRTVVLEQAFDKLFVNGAGIMFGRGELWLGGVCKHSGCAEPQVLIIAINQS